MVGGLCLEGYLHDCRCSMLPELLDHVPQLWEHLPSSSLSVLLGTSSALRQKVHDYVSKISGTMTAQDIAVFVRGLPKTYPQLTSLQLTIHGAAAISKFTHARLPTLLENLDLSENELAGPAIGYLSQGRWPKLKTLHLAVNKIANDGISHLRTTKWPSLTSIDLSNNRFGGSAIKILLCCKWPTLQTLCLSNNSLDYDWGDLTASTEWPRLRELVISRCKLSHQAARALSKPMWSCLETLDLCDNHLYDSAVCELVQAPWPLLKSLSLSDNHLQRAGVSFLITGEWPMMEQMYLKNIDLAETALGQQGLMAFTEKARDRRPIIGQTKMKFGLQTMSHLINAQWPLLEHLSLRSSVLTATDVVTQLSKGEWPLLKTLQASLLSLDASCLLPFAFLCCR